MIEEIMFRFWFAVAVVRFTPRMMRFTGRLALWGARSREDMRRLEQTSLFKADYDALKYDIVEFVCRHCNVDPEIIRASNCKSSDSPS